MASGEILANANDAMLEADYDAAIVLYTQSISLCDNRSETYSDRALANIRLKNFTDAVFDAETAIELDPSSNAKAYFRKGLAYVGLQDYHAAKMAFERGLKFFPDEKRFRNWITHLTNCRGGPTKEEHVDHNPYRREFGQGNGEVFLNIIAKSVPSTCVMVTYEEQMVGVSIFVPEERPFFYQPLLFGKIVPASCSYVVDRDKVVIRLRKAENISWKTPVAASRNNLTRDTRIVSSVQTPISYAQSVKSPYIPPNKRPSPKGKGPASPIQSSSSLSPASPIQSSSSLSPDSKIRKDNCAELDSLKLFKPNVGPRDQTFVPLMPKYSREEVKAPSEALKAQRAAKLLEHDEYIKIGERAKATAALDEELKLGKEFDAQNWKENSYIFHQENYGIETSATRFNLHGQPLDSANNLMKIQMALAQLTRCDHVLHMYVGKGGIGEDGHDHGTPEIKRDAIDRIDRNGLECFYEEDPKGSGKFNEGRLCCYLPHNKKLKLTPAFSTIPTFSNSTPSPSPSTGYSTPPTTQTQTQTQTRTRTRTPP